MIGPLDRSSGVFRRNSGSKGIHVRPETQPGQLPILPKSFRLANAQTAQKWESRNFVVTLNPGLKITGGRNRGRGRGTKRRLSYYRFREEWQGFGGLRFFERNRPQDLIHEVVVLNFFVRVHTYPPGNYQRTTAVPQAKPAPNPLRTAY